LLHEGLQAVLRMSLPWLGPLSGLTRNLGYALRQPYRKSLESLQDSHGKSARLPYAERLYFFAHIRDLFRFREPRLVKECSSHRAG
jgi:hypothetical protein